MSDAEAPFDMANFFPVSTGLPMTIWISADGRIIADSGDPSDQHAILVWAGLNRDALVRHWHGEIDAFQLSQQLRRLS